MTKLIAMSVVLLVTATLGILLGLQWAPMMPTAQVDPPLGPYAAPIFSEQQAISRALQTLPVTITVSAVAAMGGTSQPKIGANHVA
jgi:hypothetical protein